MKSNLKSQGKKQYYLAPTETEAGESWLTSLTEDVFRDQILEHLFRNMQKAGALVWYQNIHGRNDKGVDFLLVFGSDLGTRTIGIQAKSKQMTRAGGGGALSSLQIKQECEFAMRHEFTVQTNKARLDNIEVWSSAHVTEDAEKEFNLPSDPIKIQIKKPAAIFSLIEKYCPEFLKNVPHCALAVYVKNKREPEPKKLKLLGCQLSPKTHFLEPIFSKRPFDSVTNVQTKDARITKKANVVSLNDIVFGPQHSLIKASELSGKSYLLDHIEWLIADSTAVPIRVDRESFGNEKPHSIFSFIAKQLKFYSPKDVEQLVANVRVFLLVDDIECIGEELRTFLFNQNPKHVKVVATARSLSAHTGVDVVYMNGVNLSSITRFLRSLDIGLANTRPFTDRAHSFISRALMTSGLPSTPFTISMMLAECQHSAQRFSTPTMGRLIERFVEMQLGSHSDNTNRVDFETKREFLTKLAGRTNLKFRPENFRKELLKFIESRSHPHSIDDFLLDLKNSGVFTFTEEDVSWSHPVIKQFYWVKNLGANNRTLPITRKLQSNYNVTLAALAGSQLRDGERLITTLIADLGKIKLPPPQKLLKTVQEIGAFPFMDNTDQEEEEWLNTILSDTNDASKKTQHPIAQLADGPLATADHAVESTEEGEAQPVQIEITDEAKEELRKKLEPFMMRMAESKLHIAFNLAAILVNARHTRADKKRIAVQKIIEGNQFLGNWFFGLLEAIYADKKTLQFNLNWTRIYFQLQLTDRMVGDPHLINIYKKLLASPKNDDELLMLLDLVLCCGEEDFDLILRKLKQIGRSELIVAFYFRVVVLLFFRFHREKDGRALRQLLKDIRRVHKTIHLPALASS